MSFTQHESPKVDISATYFVPQWELPDLEYSVRSVLMMEMHQDHVMTEHL